MKLSLSPRSLMARGDRSPLAVPASPDLKGKSLNAQQRRQELEQEVTQLQKMLEDEEKVHEVLERALLPLADRSPLHIPSFLPKKTKELLAELVMVEGEIARLESEISKSQQASKEMQENQVHESLKSNPYKHASRSSVVPLEKPMMSPVQSTKSKVIQEKLALETKPLFFINQAIKGDYTIHGFTSKRKTDLTVVETPDKKESQKAAGFQDKVPRRSGMIEKQSSPKLPPRHSTSRKADANIEMLLKSLQEPSSTTNSSEKKWQPNKLSEKIMKCLLCIFRRLIRTSRVSELEKSSNLFGSTNSFLRSGSFRAEGGLNLKANLSIQRETRQQDPYGIFEIEDSLVRDIGPYKNLIRFTSSSLDIRGISGTLPLLKKLRILISNLRDVDLKFLTQPQKLAFWVNIYNACIMHGFLEHGLLSNVDKVLALRSKAVLNIGGYKLNALTIEHFLLRQPSNYSEASLNGHIDAREEAVRSIYGLEHPEPNVTFALCCGNRSSPAVRIYTADGISVELERSKLEYFQASVVVTAAKRIMIPKLLLSNMHDFATDLGSLVDWICSQLPTSGSLRKSMAECMKSKGKRSDVVDIMPYDFEFQYLLPM